ncbi:MAG: hypothetical protein JRH17_17840 [Deltaproteobacteria bacterium]|nr:hypothetical protein [Deltaproteobacteria bacterium]
MNTVSQLLLILLGATAITWGVAAASRYRRIVGFRRNIRERCDDFLATARSQGHLDYPPPWLGEERDTRGIVMCAGGPDLLTQAYTNLDVLRNHHGCRLPVALFYVGREEMPEACQHFFEESFSNLRCIDASRITDRPGQPRAKNLRGFELKPFSLLNAPFDELIFIDADSVPLYDPELLFESELYREHGNLFWPEACMLSTLVPHAGAWSEWSLTDGRARGNIQGVNPRIFDHLRLPRPSTLERAGYETESGQILIDRRRCFDAVALTWFMSSRPHHFRLYFYGDTEAYRLAWGVTERPYCQIPHPSHQVGVVEDGIFLGRAILPRDESGAPAFLHQMHRKPSPSGPCPPLTHIVEDLAVDHPRSRALRGLRMRAEVESLSHIRAAGGAVALIDELIRKSHAEFLIGLGEAHLPGSPPKHWLNRRILPW